MKLIDRKNNLNIKVLHFLVASLVAIFTTGWMRVHLIPWGVESDGGTYTFMAYYFYQMFPNIPSEMPLFLYSTITSWVYALEINQWMALRWIDLCLAVIASIIFFKVIIKESASLPFAFIISISSFLIMNDIRVIKFGFSNSIWAAYIPFFTVLLISQNVTKDNHYVFYFIGGLAALGVLLREPLILYFIVGGGSILIGYGWRSFLKYSIGAALLGFPIVGAALMLRGWDLVGLIHGYSYIAKVVSDFNLIFLGSFIQSGLIMASEFWYGLILFIISVFYITKNFLSDNKINLGRFAFWLAIAFVPLIEAGTKLATPYHFAQCVPGFVGFIALTWKHLSFNESKTIQQYSMIFIYLLCFFGVYSKLHLIYNNYHAEKTLKNAYNQLWTDLYRHPETIKTSNYLISAYIIRQLSNKDSTLALGGVGMEGLYPLTGLLPPTYKLVSLRALYASLEFNENQLVNILREWRPTIIMPSRQYLVKNYNKLIWGIDRLPRAIQRTGLYELVAIIEYNENIEAAPISGNIYRLKTFVKEEN
tara:strand:+ start:128 stop:1729 length:1602 start_codon:yes stop_codon:yes gene_type:complete